ncbi:endonuclease [Labilibaculum sp.]|uniref:endonuclease n=1 Tax=Labilibaculum sp. TaxID=2060723 RepID=UPI002AA61DEB|nr:endonuclease [Labilibaculum sp.]
MMSAQVSFGQGLENFDTYPYSSTAYSNTIPDWIGVNGIKWSLDVGAKGAGITGITPLIGSNGKNGFPKGGILTSSSIAKGIGNLSFKYKKAFSSNSQISIYINDILIESISAESSDVAVYTKEINVDGDFTFKFKTTERTLIDDIEWTAYGSAPVQSSAKAITSFLIDGKAGILNEGAHTIGVTLPESTNVTALSPVIKISDKASVLPASGASQDFTNTVTYTVTAEDGSNQTYEVTVNLEIPVVSNLLINELDCDQVSTDTKEFVELYDGGVGNTSLDGYILVLYNGSNDLSYATYDLAGQTTNAQGFFVIGSTEVENVNLSPSGFSLQNGADAVALYKAPAANFPNNTVVTTENVVDFVVYDTDDADDAGLLAGITAGEQINENASGDMANHSIYRASDGEGGARNTTAFVAGIPTPGKSNGGAGTAVTVNLALSAVSASEADQTVITLTAAASKAVSESQTLDVTISGTGITTGDYTLSAAQFTFAAGESTASASLTIVDDADVEGTESMTVSISNPSAGIQLGTNVSASISIADNDGNTGSILANYVYLAPETNGDGSIVVNLTPKEYVQTVSPSHHMGSVKIPADYYSSAVGFNGTALREHIHTIIETGAEAQSYSTVWNMCEDGDQNPKDASQVWQMYVEQGIAKTAHVSGITGWNREHTWAKSHGDFGTSDGPGTDGHHLRATDAQENSVRGSRDFADEAPGYTPPKSARGDVARMIFYMATRWDMTVDDQCKETESAARHGKLSDLLKWHEEDPVDPYEVRRNNVIYGYQHNRNPFVDHPELVQYIFGEAKVQTWNGGIGTEPAKIKITGTLADFGMVKFGEESVVQTFTVSANSLSENASITSPQHFLISKDGNNFSSSLALTVADGIIAETTISVKFVPESAVSAKVSGDLQITSGTNSKSIAVSAVEGDPALVPLAFLQEDFETDTHSNWILKSEIGDRNWAITEFSSNKYMQMSAYKATGEVTSWLISPELDLDAYNNEKLNFKTKNGYFKGLALEVFISTDYDGGDVSAATWQKLAATIDERNNAAYGADFVESGDIDLSAYEGTAHIAFKYTGNGSSVTTTYQVDDVVVEGNKIPLTGSFGSNLIADLEFPFTEVGAVSEPMLYELNFDKIEGDISIQVSDNYEISLDGITYESKVSVDKSEVSPVLITVRFAPKTAVINGSSGTITHKAKAAESLEVPVSSLASTEIADASTLGRDKTLDIVSWNVEWFGSPAMSKHASSFDEQLTAVSEKIIELDADIYAIQELVSDNVNGDFLQALVDKLNVLAGEDLYAASMGARYSHDDSAPSTDYPAQRICYIYNQTTVSNLGDFSMFSDLYPDTSTASIDGYTGDASSFWASGRLPYLFEAEVFIDGQKENIKLVNIHAKCCQDSHSRKLADAKFLMNELNANYSNDNLVILGDYNDYLEGSMTSGAASPYASWFETKDYFDHVITSSTNIDHITISNELYDEYQVLTNNTSEENVSISDHHPILLRLKLRSDKISKKSQNITFADLADKTYGDAAFELVASASSGLEVNFELVSGPATLSGKELTLTGAGTVVVKVVQAGDENYEAAEAVSRTFIVNKASQDIAFAELTDKTYGDAAFELQASASSGLEVSFELVSGPATLSGKELTLTGAGTVVVKAVQAGNENYEAAESVSRTFTVNKASQDIAFAELTDKTYGDPAFELVASASSGLEVSFELISGPATLSGKELTLMGAGTVVVKAVQAGNENYEVAESVSRTFTVAGSKENQTITFVALADKTFGDPAFELVASASSGLEVNFELVSGPATLSGKELILTGAGAVVVKAVQAGNENYEAAESVSRTFTVEKASQTITFEPIEGLVVVGEPIQLSAVSSEGLTVAFELLQGNGELNGSILTPTLPGEFKVRAHQDGNANIESAEEFQFFTVSQPTGLKEIFEKIVKIYPNPSRDFVSIDLPDADVIKILILNSRGQVVKTIQPHEKYRINIQDLVTGTYFISIQTDQFIVTKRLMVVR